MIPKSTLVFLLSSFASLVSSAQRAVPAAYPTSTYKLNMVRARDVKKPITDAPAADAVTNVAEVSVTSFYYDGLGRPVQTVAKQSSPSLKDEVTAVEYDAYGRQAFRYLPFSSTVPSTGGGVTNDGKFKSNPFFQQEAFYNSYLNGQNEQYFYGVNKFEASPMDRVIESYPAGNSWSGSAQLTVEGSRHGIDIRYSLNSVGDNVLFWPVTEGPLGTFSNYPSVATSYAAGVLTKIITEDEQGGQTIEFKDKGGNIVLKKVLLTANRDLGGTSHGHDGWLNTYYMYDKLGRLRCVLQPKGERLYWEQGALNANIITEQCFRYEYDEKNRMILKTVPGAGKSEMVYDQRDRLIMSRDSSLAKQGYWLINKYDDLNRLIKIGLVPNGNSRATHQASADGNINYPTLTATDVMQENYYDNYSWITPPTPQQGIASTIFTADYLSSFFNMNYNQAPEYAQEVVADYINVKGKATGSRVRIFGTTTYLHSVVFYDAKGRAIQTRDANISGGYDIVTTQYNFSGQPIRSLHRQEKGGANARYIRELTTYTYDHAGRVTNIKKKVGESAANERILVENDYDEMGRLKNKTIGNGLETQTYDYNIRGWLLGVNRNYVKGTTTNYFGYDLGYDNPNSVVPPGGYYPSYRGDIGGLTWRSAGDAEKRKYKFSYDAAHRLMKAEFNQFNPANNAFDNGAGFDFTTIMGDGIHPDSAYDVNGNIKKMRNVGWKENSSSLVDELLYTYQNGSNRLAKVDDLINDPNSKSGDFKNGTNTGDDYTYDVNGSLASDNNKGISTILYTHLNMPYEIRIPGKGKILYTYDNLGTKWKKTVYDSTVNPARVTTWLYMQNFVYCNDTLEFFGHEEGRARYDNTQTTTEATAFHFDYFLKDHLGNVRMVLTEEKDTVPYVPLTYEDANLSLQNAIWENASGGIVNVGNRNNRPAGMGTSATNGSYAKLVRKSTGPIMAAKLLKVMAGDRIHTKVDYFYWVTNANNSGANAFNSLVANLATSLLASSQVSAALKEGASGVVSSLGNNAGFVSWLNTPNTTSGSNSAPKAYLNILVFDDQMRPDNVATTVIPVPYTPGVVGTIGRMFENAVTARKNGYVYIYFSNESDEIVYLDNFMLTHELGPIREETHYYPFGLTMAGISSRAIGKLENKYKFNEGSELQNKEFSDGSGLEMYDVKFRTYDAQIGRFMQIDPLAQAGVDFTPYHYANNNPILLNDPFGLLSDSANPQVLPEVVVTARKKDNTSPWQLGVEWLTGKGPREHHFKDGDAFTESLKNHEHIQDTRNQIINGLGKKTIKLKTPYVNPYNLGGISGIPKYLRDYSTLLTLGATGNIAVTYLGSYALNYEVVSIDEQSGTAVVNFSVGNSSTAASGFRPPVIGYTDVWKNTVGQAMNKTFSSGPMSKTTQTVQWTETIKWNAGK